MQRIKSASKASSISVRPSVLRQIALVMCLYENLNVRLVRARRVDQCLKHRNAVFRAIAFLAARWRQQAGAPRRRPGRIRLSESRFFICASRSRVFAALNMPSISALRRLFLELAYLTKIVEFGFAPCLKISFESRYEDLGLRTNSLSEQFYETLTLPVLGRKKGGFTLRRNLTPASCNAVYRSL